jgi:putative ABC transport system ATP-binding protein
MSIEIDHLSKTYALGKITVSALQDVNLRIEKGEFTAIAGPSGCGKSTLLNMIGCMDVPTSGELRIDGQPISKLNDRELTNLRLEKIGFIFQTFNLISVLSVFQNVEFPLLIKGGLSAKVRAERVNQLLDRVELTQFAKHKSNELSGGQRQRVAIARALVTSPAVVLADEPTANLDSATGDTIIALMKEINNKEQTTFVFSTHDPAVMQHAHRIIKLKDGKIAN